MIGSYPKSQVPSNGTLGGLKEKCLQTVNTFLP